MAKKIKPQGMTPTVETLDQFTAPHFGLDPQQARTAWAEERVLWLKQQYTKLAETSGEGAADQWLRAEVRRDPSLAAHRVAITGMPEPDQRVEHVHQHVYRVDPQPNAPAQRTRPNPPAAGASDSQAIRTISVVEQRVLRLREVMAAMNITAWPDEAGGARTSTKRQIRLACEKRFPNLFVPASSSNTANRFNVAWRTLKAHWR
jgi:hypothetical protein